MTGIIGRRAALKIGFLNADIIAWKRTTGKCVTTIITPPPILSRLELIERRLYLCLKTPGICPRA
jgi:hypothetical protein